MSREGPIERSVLGDQIKDRLLQEIMAGRYAPGERIVETRVARELGTSQAPVREALRDLEALGVVEINAFKGARVRHPSTSELLEAYAIRAELESLAARLAMPRMTDADFDELQGCLAEMQEAALAGDAHGGAVADTRFHARVVELSGNRTLGRLWRHLEPLSRTYITIMSSPNVRRIADLHVPIITALRQGDPERAAAAYHEHFEAAGAIVEEKWDAQGTPLDGPGARGPIQLGRQVARLAPRVSIERRP
jgi:DNA-binding GntR family transcriptional regulator